MSIIVSVVGFVILLLGAVGVTVPAKLKQAARPLVDKERFYIAAVIRVAVGVVCLLAADATRAPGFVSFIGVLLIFAGVLIPIVGPARLRVFVEWWLNRSEALIRLWALVAMVLGLALVWAGM